MAVEEHRRRGQADFRQARAAIVTVSDSRTLATDATGKLLAAGLEADGQLVLERRLCRDDPAPLRALLEEFLATDVDVILLNGGTGIARRDGTVEVVRALLEREIPGFGELFRYLSYKQVGAAAMLSRAVAGSVGRRLIFALPGSTKAARLALDKLILPELAHLLYELHKDA